MRRLDFEEKSLRMLTNKRAKHLHRNYYYGILLSQSTKVEEKYISLCEKGAH